MMLTPLAALASLLLFCLPATTLQETSVAQGPRAVDRNNPLPAVDEIPLPPGVELPEKTRNRAPAPGDIPRNGFQARRFSEQGQSVEFTFEAQAGELSLFELATWGYARSWNSLAEIQILDEEGTQLVTLQRRGLVTYRKFLPFVAPHSGVYRYRLTALEQMFRFTLVRHSDYSPVDLVPLNWGDRPAMHGFLGDPDESRTYDLELEAGQEVALQVANDYPTDRKKNENMRRRHGPAELARNADFPDFVLQVLHEGQPISEVAHFLLVTPEQSGTHQVVVTATSTGEGGLFVAELEREPARVEVTGSVGNEDDDPVQGITLRFLREPSSDFLGEATTDENGEFQLSVLTGTYTVHVGRAHRAVTEVVKANIEHSRELNLVWAH